METSFKVLRPILTVLLLFIPLYPKFPLFSVQHTYVAIRLDDIIVAVCLAVWLIYQIKKGFTFQKNKLFFLVGLYFAAISISFLNALIVLKTESPNILLLHLFRRFEYMSLLFVAYDAIYTKSDLNYPLITIAFSLFLTCFYGLGQKFLSWPIVSTMNEEFSKGYILTLTKWSRISSTFAGHYDFAVFLSLVSVVFLSLSVFIKKNYLRFILLFLWCLAFYCLTLTASRVSLFAYLFGITLSLLLLRKFLLIPLIWLVTIFFVFNSQDLSQRLIATAKQINPNFNFSFLQKNSRLPSPTITPTPTIIIASTTTTPGSVYPKITEIPTPTIYHHPPEEKFVDVDIDAGVARSGEIRFNVEWPRAINAFRSNPVLGTGLGSLSLATDNDYLRCLGESGILGFFSFGLIHLYFLLKSLKKLSKSPVIGVLFCTMVTFLINAAMIDVFEASKTAYLYWMFMGLYQKILDKDYA